MDVETVEVAIEDRVYVLALDRAQLQRRDEGDLITAEIAEVRTPSDSTNEQ